MHNSLQRQLDEMKTNYKNLENELHQNKVDCSKAVNNYQALEIEIQLLRKRLVTFIYLLIKTSINLEKKHYFKHI